MLEKEDINIGTLVNIGIYNCLERKIDWLAHLKINGIV